jgi:protein Mpv17
VYTIVNIPINVFWQEWLEATFPGSKPAPVPTAAADEKKASKPVKSDKQVRDVKNTLIKFAMDQSVGAAFNIPIFLATIGAVKGQGWEQILDTVRRVSQG